LYACRLVRCVGHFFILEKLYYIDVYAHPANQQFVDAAKLMAGSSIEARAAGNYAFEKLVIAYPDYYNSVISTLLAFAWQNRPAQEQFNEGVRPSRIDSDVNAAVYVIGKLPLQWERLYVRDYYLAGASFSGLPSFRGAEFLGARLFGTNFTWADLTSARFNGARLEDWVSYGWRNNSWQQRMLRARESFRRLVDMGAIPIHRQF